MLFDNRIRAAEKRLIAARLRLHRDMDDTSNTFVACLRSPRALLVAGALGFVWGMRPGCEAGESRSRSALADAGKLAARAALTHWLSGVVT